MGSATVSICNVLFSRTQRRVLGLLFGDPGRSFYANEVVRFASAGTGSVQRELARMESAGLIKATRIGNQKHYQANRDCPIFEELRGIVVKTFGVAEVLREALKPLASRVTAAFVYGSVAKGSDTAGSDIDVMIVSDSLSYPDVIAALDSAERALGRPIHPTLQKPDELRRKWTEDNAFVRRVLEQPKIFLIGSAGDLQQS